MVRGRRPTKGRCTRGRVAIEDDVVSRRTRQFSHRIPQPSTPFHGTIQQAGTFPNEIRKQIGCLVKGNIPNDEVTWGQWSDDNKQMIWDKFLKFFTFDDLDYARAAFENYLTINYVKWMNRARIDAKKEAGVDELDETCRGYPPRYLTKDQWNGMMNKFLAPEFREKSKKNSSNRNINDEYLVYKGGSASFEANTQALSRRLGREASFSESFLSTHTPLNDRGKTIMTEYERLNKEALERRKNDSDESTESDDSVDDESTQASTSYRQKKVIFKNDAAEAWLQATGGKKKGRILGMRVGDDSMLSQGKKKGKEPRLSKEEMEMRKKEEFDAAVAEAVEKRMEVLKNEQMEALEKQQEERLQMMEQRLLERFAHMVPSPLPSSSNLPSVNTTPEEARSRGPLDLSEMNIRSSGGRCLVHGFSSEFTFPRLFNMKF